LLVPTLIVSAGVVITSNRIARREQQESARLRARAAEAELALLTLRRQIARASAPRGLSITDFSEALRGRTPPELAVGVWYQPDDPEAADFALLIVFGLREAGKEWYANDPRPLDLRMVEGRGNPTDPILTRLVGGNSALTLVANDIDARSNPSIHSLRETFAAIGYSAAAARDERMTDGLVFIVVGPKHE
jgi:hypothetical protein